MKFLFKIVAVLIFSFFVLKPVSAQENYTNIYFFWARGCPHCNKEKIFLTKLSEKYPQIRIKDYEISSSQENARLLYEFGKELSADVSGVPFTIIGDQYVTGFYNEEITGVEIEEKIQCAIEGKCIDLLEKIKKDNNLIEKNAHTKSPIPENINIPIFGQIKTQSMSLPVFTFFIALLDGFNPCAMWVLIFLISLLLGMKNRLKILILGTAFIISSSVVYFLFLTAWLNLFLFIGLVIWVRLIIGAVALSAGVYNVRDFYINKNAACKVTSNKKRQKVFKRLKDITKSGNFLLALTGIILLAFAVNLVELVCSAGLPAIYTQVLSLSKLPTWQYYSYLVFYILIFMLDDLIVFFLAITTLHAVGIDSKYARFSHLFGGAVMIIIGLLMWFRPELLMFG